MRVVTAFVLGTSSLLLAALRAVALGCQTAVIWILRRLPLVWNSPDLFGKQDVHHRRLTVKNIPGPRAWPLLGTRWIFSPLVGRYKLSQAHEAYHAMFEQYGDIVKEEVLFNIPVISVRAAADIELVYKSNPKYPIRPPDTVSHLYRSSRPDRYKGPGLVNVQGEEWARLRKLSTPDLMSSHVMHDFLPELNNVVDDLHHLIVELRDPQTDLLPDFLHVGTQMGLESSCVLMLGQRMGFLEVELGATATRLKEAVRDHFNACRDGFYGLPLWKIFPTAAYRKLMRSEETLYDIISSMVEPAMEQSADTCPVGAVQSVLMNVLRRPELDIREKKSTIIDFIAAGIHTIGNSTAILLHLVATHPQVQQRLYEEILELTPHNEPLTARHLQAATYLKACVQESFRLVSTAALLARITSEDMEFSGYFVPAGSVVLCHLREACNDDRNFVRAKEFLPERWLPREAAKLGLVPHFPFLTAPFGFTRRICPGKKFAELEMSLFIAKTVRRFELSCSAPLQLQFEFLLTPSGEMPIVFRDR